MSHRLTTVCSPLRDKRRQSDAKWRASVATCYDVLKYVVPNVKHMSKKKISKALILQECEKHIQDLEDTISYLFHVECKNQGQIALWKEGDYWSHCSMDKLHEDFTEKQRRVFLISAHGRRCYNLLQDIKEEVFDMKADSKQMAFVSEDSLSLMNNSEDVNDSLIGTHTVSLLPFPVDSMNELVVSEHSQTTGDQSKGAMESASDTSKQGDLQHLPSSSISSIDSSQVRQQPRPRQRFFSDNENDIDTALLQGLNDGGKKTGIAIPVSSYEPMHLLSAESGKFDQQQIIHCVISSSSTSDTGTSSSLSVSHGQKGISDNVNNMDHSDVLDNGDDNHRLKLEKLTDSFYVLSKEKDYPFLLEALKAEKEQEVPSMETPNKTTKIKRPRLSSGSTDTDFLTSCSGGNIKQVGCVSEHNMCTDVSDNIFSKCYTSQSVGSKISTLTASSSPFSSLAHSTKSDIKLETDDSSPCNDRDPLLSSLNTPNFDADTPLFFWSQYDGVTKRPPKFGSARRKLNFNSPSYSGWPHTSPRLVNPDRVVPGSPVVTGFTPIKLPDDLTRHSDVSSGYSTSPWKSVHSPFNYRTVSQGYIDSSLLVDLEDNLFCMETLDTLDFEDGLGSQLTPAATENVEKTQQPGELLKGKASPVPGKLGSRMKPTCRRRLEGFYDQSTATGEFVNLSDESHVVPQLDITLWTSVADDFHSHLDSSSADDVEDNLICLETIDTLELGNDVDS